MTVGYLTMCLSTVPESLGMPVTGSPSMLKGYHNSLIDGSPWDKLWRKDASIE